MIRLHPFSPQFPPYTRPFAAMKSSSTALRAAGESRPVTPRVFVIDPELASRINTPTAGVHFSVQTVQAFYQQLLGGAFESLPHLNVAAIRVLPEKLRAADAAIIVIGTPPDPPIMRTLQALGEEAMRKVLLIGTSPTAPSGCFLYASGTPRSTGQIAYLSMIQEGFELRLSEFVRARFVENNPE